MARTGRPSSYKPAYCKRIVEYFERAAKAKPRALAPVETSQSDSKGGYKKREVRRICAELPTLEGFACSIGVSSQTLLRWTEEHEEFREAHARAKDIQKRLLMDRGLTRQYDPTAFVFVAKNITDMADKQVLAGDANNPVAVQVKVEFVRPKDEAAQ